jgi:hypothetical protein
VELLVEVRLRVGIPLGHECDVVPVCVVCADVVVDDLDLEEEGRLLNREVVRVDVRLPSDEGPSVVLDENSAVLDKSSVVLDKSSVVLVEMKDDSVVELANEVDDSSETVVLDTSVDALKNEVDEEDSTDVELVPGVVDGKSEVEKVRDVGADEKVKLNVVSVALELVIDSVDRLAKDDDSDVGVGPVSTGVDEETKLVEFCVG